MHLLHVPVPLISPIHPIAVSEHRRKIALALPANKVMVIVILRPAIERNKPREVPREIIPAMRIQSLQLPHRNPQPERNDMPGRHRGPRERRHPENHNLKPMRIRRSEAHRRRELMVHGMNLLIPPPVVQPPVQPVVPVILHHGVHRELQRDLPERRQRQPEPDPDELHRRKRTQLQRPHHREERPHDHLVAPPCLRRLVMHPGLHLPLLRALHLPHIQQHVRQRRKREDHEQEHDVHAVQLIVTHIVRRAEPYLLPRRQRSGQRALRRGRARERDHLQLFLSPNTHNPSPFWPVSGLFQKRKIAAGAGSRVPGE
ncbi:hypothetical protein KC19_4G028700 [Ceratodon purpureus]|uniref:Uncharacterized protein n=1 Tax=Ceratodon purpureus TaxID=3225 RepID=A0A8T0I7W5_CERPU|nr:hypothetical protein KC19_4G028700 [Ceratodon purpureus]